MDVIAKGIPRGCQGSFTPVSLGYPLSVFNKNSTLKGKKNHIYTIYIYTYMHTGSSREVETTVFDPASQFLRNISRHV